MEAIAANDNNSRSKRTERQTERDRHNNKIEINVVRNKVGGGKHRSNRSVSRVSFSDNYS